MDIGELIRTAKIGRERKDAQVDSCTAFAAALYDVLSENGYSPSMVAAHHRGATTQTSWYHQVVEVDGTMYDSLGEFSADIVRARHKVRNPGSFPIEFTRDRRDGCYDEDDYQGIYEFVLKELRKSAAKLSPAADVAASVVRAPFR